MTQNSFPDWPARMQTASQAVRASLGGVSHAPQRQPSAPKLRGVECVTEEDSLCIHLVRLRVAEHLRRTGLGSRYVNALKDRAREVRKPIRVLFSPDDGCEDGARRFYKKHGFRFLSDCSTLIWKP